MIRKIGLVTLTIMTALFSNTALSTTQHVLVPNMNVNYELQPKVPEILTNFVLWQINAKCVLSVESETASISVMASNKQSIVNGKTLPLNEKVPLEVKDNDTLLITAPPGAKVELVNLGERLLVASCSLA